MYMSSKFNQLEHERESFAEQFSSRNRNACRRPGSKRTQNEKGEVDKIQRKEGKSSICQILATEIPNPSIHYAKNPNFRLVYDL